LSAWRLTLDSTIVLNIVLVVAVLAIMLLLWLANYRQSISLAPSAVTARRAWHSNMQVTLGGVLVLQAVIDLLTSLPDILTYWVTFWVEPTDRVRWAVGDALRAPTR
jgi:hypothetical protein